MRQALYQAILDAPEDDVPRLVYADWLEEHGDEKDRIFANFVRWSIRVANLTHISRTPEQEDIYRTGQRTLRSLRKLCRNWAPRPKGAEEQVTLHFHKGFPALANLRIGYSSRPLKDLIQRLVHSYPILGIGVFGQSNPTHLMHPHLMHPHIVELLDIVDTPTWQQLTSISFQHLCHTVTTGAEGPRLAQLIRGKRYVGLPTRLSPGTVTVLNWTRSELAAIFRGALPKAVMLGRMQMPPDQGALQWLHANKISLLMEPWAPVVSDVTSSRSIFKEDPHRPEARHYPYYYVVLNPVME